MNNGCEARPTVSVVMTVYEPHAVFFRKAVESILAQSWRDFELIIVEDPSPSRGDKLLDGVSDSRLRHVVNAGRTSLVEQKNLGLEMAAGRYIALMDADDVAHPSRLARQLEYLETQPNTMVLGSQIMVIDAQDRVVGHRRFPLEHGEILNALPRIVPLSQPSVMFRREVIESFGMYRPTEYAVAEDYELWSRWIRQGVRFANHPEQLLSYRLHPGQTKFVRLRETILADLRVKEEYWTDALDMRSRLWWQAQRLLLILPEWLVGRLLVFSLYRDHEKAFSSGVTS